MHRILLIVLLSFLLVLSSCVGSRSSGVYHTVSRGQTLYSISKTYDVDEQYLARINRISDPTRLRVGERIYIPGANQVLSVPVTVLPDIVDPTPVKKQPFPQTTAPKSAESKPVAKPVHPIKSAPIVPPVVPTSRPAATIEKGKLIWPVRGVVVKKFDSRTGGSKGVEIAVAADTPVASAAAGKVIYSGDGITGYGNLIIIRHDDTMFTVYGYNRKHLVDVGAFVSKGEKIALAGAPPAGGKVRLYFEIRLGKKPVDPIFYLP
ncbi:MAG: LysM peptidoglycan-binding domain-containing protein [Candidatus Zixiibacteriota bacterium]|nr:MAG: LysM peptidoglycan-binding domain-containing protein [candidate division Zixibacteria bacterium]